MTASFGLDAALLPAPYSAIVSVLLLAGFFAVGRLVSRVACLWEGGEDIWEASVAPVVGAAVLAVVLYPLILFGWMSPSGVRILAAALATLGACWVVARTPRAWVRLKSLTDSPRGHHWGGRALVGVLVSGFALVALGPATNADSLNYHLGVALKFMQEGAWPVDPEWFHSRLAGSGETLIALGLAVGAEQFGSLLQWTGLFTLAGLMLRFPAGNRPLATVLALVLVSSPVLLFLISSDKPQLLPIAMTTTALALACDPSRREASPRVLLWRFGLICLLVMAASQMKLNFLVSGSLVGLVAFVLMARRRLALPALGIAAGCLVCIVVPPAIWKHQQFGGPLASAFLTPFPGEWPGYASFVSFLRDYRDSPLPFPISLVMPASAGLVSTVLGVGVFAFFWLRPRRDLHCWLVVSAAMGVIIVGTAFGQSSARFYFEPFVWVLMALSLQPLTRTDRFVRPVLILLALQITLSAALIAYAVARSFPGALFASWRDQVMTQQADGYTLMKWVDRALPTDAVLATFHPSIALAPRRAFASDWTVFVGRDLSGSVPYLERLKQGGLTHALVFGEPSASPLAACFSGPEAGPFQSVKATRNPMNSGRTFTAWLMKVDRTRLPGCYGK